MQDATRRPRRRHSTAEKAEILEACSQPGASVAGVALAYGINANLLHRWRGEANVDAPAWRGRRDLAEFVPLAVAAPPSCRRMTFVSNSATGSAQ